MLTRREIAAGKFYVNEHKQSAREVVEVMDRKWVKFNVYSLTNGRLMHGLHQTCERDEMIQWADREATAEECAMLEHDQVSEIFVSLENETAGNDAGHEIMKAQMVVELRQHGPSG